MAKKETRRADGTVVEEMQHETPTPVSSILDISDVALRYPINVSVGVVSPWIRYEIFKFTPKKGGKGNVSQQSGSGYRNKPVVTEVLHTIAMPFDQQIAITTAQKWDPAGKRAGFIESAISGDISGAFGDLGEGVQTAAARGGSKGTKKGEALIDKVALKYDGPEQRSFTLTHTMIPKNKKEEDNIQEIIKMFRWSSSPEYKPFKLETATSYNFPNLYRVSWMLGKNKNLKIPHYDIAYLSSVAVTFGDDNFSRFESGAPTVYEMTLSFTEMEFINKAHIAVNHF
jgi:hypothetical protein